MVKPKQILNFEKFIANSSVKTVLQTLEDNGYEAYLAGGAVRDMLLNKQPYDFDIATNARPKDVKRLFPKHTTKGEMFGTIAVQMNDSEIFEITTYRSDDVYSNSRHPDQIKFADSLLQDSERRDFTINAMYADLRGIISDPQHGLKDLERKRLKTVGSAEDRFGEDALRVLRAFRFMSQLGFSMDANEQDAAVASWSDLSKVSSERIYNELKKMIEGLYFEQVLPLFIEKNLFEYFVDSNPFRKANLNLAEVKDYLVQRLQRRSLKTKLSHPQTDELSDSAWYGIELFLLELALLQTTDYESYLKAWMEFLPFRKLEKNKIEQTIHWFRYMNSVSRTKDEKNFAEAHGTFLGKMENTVVGRSLRLGLEAFSLGELKLFMTSEFLALFHLPQNLSNLLITKLEDLKHTPTPLISGKDLMAEGVKPGPALREIISMAYEIQLVSAGLTRKELLARCQVPHSG